MSFGSDHSKRLNGGTKKWPYYNQSVKLLQTSLPTNPATHVWNFVSGAWERSINQKFGKSL